MKVFSGTCITGSPVAVKGGGARSSGLSGKIKISDTFSLEMGKNDDEQGRLAWEREDDGGVARGGQSGAGHCARRAGAVRWD